MSRSSEAPPSPGRRYPTGDHEWPFVGRADLLERVRHAVARERRSVVLAGPAGVGKSRLGLRALEAAAAEGCPTAHITGTRAAAEIPFGAVAGLLPAAEAGRGAVDTRADLLRRCVRELAGRGANRPLVLLVDDVHLLDRASATMLQLAVAERACIVLATLRTGEPVADAVTSLWKDGHATREDVAGLSEAEVSALLPVALGGQVDSASVARLFEQSGGNALYLRELVRGAHRAGTLIRENQLWRLAGRAPVSGRLIELVETRLGDLAPPERTLLELVAYGEPLGPAELRALSGEELAEDLERRGFLTSRREGRRLQVRLAHPVYADALLARLPALRVQRMARSLADVVEATGARRREDLLRVATWRLEGGGTRPDLMLRAAFSARWSYDFPLAERLARAASDDGAGFEADLLAAQLSYLQGRGVEAERMLAGLDPGAGTDEQRARVALARLECAIFLAHIDPGLAIAEQAEARIADPGWRHQITARRAGLLLAAAGPRAAVEVAEPLLTTSTGRALVWACLIACVGLGRLGRIADAVAAADLGHTTQVDVTSPLEYYPWLHTYFRGDALLYSGAIIEALDIAREQHELAVRQHSTEAQAYFGIQLAKPVGETGDVAGATRRAREAAALLRDLGRPALLETCLVELAIGLALAGRPDEAQATLLELDELRIPRSYYTVEVLRARAWVAISRDDLAEARELLDQAARVGEQIGDLVGALDALHTLGRLGRPRGALSRARLIADRVEGPLAAGRLAHIDALAAGDADALDRASRTFEDIGAHLLAAESAADAERAAAGRATAQRAAVLRRRTAALRARCPDAVTPALNVAPDRSGLTPAESDAARLAATGWSNKDIAAKLHLSVRTVEGQLQRAYEKLSITRRADLGEALRAHDR